MSLTRNDLESDQIQQSITQVSRTQTLSEEDLKASIAQILQQQEPDTEIWIFAYGSLIWNPIIKFVDRQVVTLYGFHRCFCLWTPFGRGTLDNRGLVLGLDRGGSCRGIIYRIAPEDIASELPLLWRREMMMGCYIPRRIKVAKGKQTWMAIAFIVNSHHRAYASNLSTEVIVEHIATASGTLGSCSDYLFQTVEGLAQVGIKDRPLQRLQKQVLARQASAGKDSAIAEQA